MAIYDASNTNKSKKSSRDFIALNLDFARNVVTNDIVKIEGVDAVKRSVKNLIQTNFYERPFHPELGCGVRELLFENFISYWSKNNESIIKNKKTYLFENYNLIYSVFFYFLFYLCVSTIFLSKKLLNRSLNTKSIFLFILLVFLYYLFVPKIVLDNFQYIFQVISILIFILI